MSIPCHCAAPRHERWPVLHHMPCAYVGPTYDFISRPGGYLCPKCDIVFASPGSGGEILGYSLRCQACGAEWLEDDTP